MEKISPRDIAALSSTIGKKCSVQFDVVGFPNQVYKGLITKIELNDRTGKFRVVIEIDGMGIAIPTEYITSLEIED